MFRVLSYRRLSMYALCVAKMMNISKSPKVVATMAEQFKALGDPTRLNLMMAVAASGDAEATRKAVLSA